MTRRERSLEKSLIVMGGTYVVCAAVSVHRALSILRWIVATRGVCGFWVELTTVFVGTIHALNNCAMVASGAVGSRTVAAVVLGSKDGDEDDVVDVDDSLLIKCLVRVVVGLEGTVGELDRVVMVGDRAGWLRTLGGLRDIAGGMFGSGTALRVPDSIR